ncbi:hypothetical protein FKX85_16395 [Echinicola soli]|uniref:Uncharacterized protein n=1 Tax=Echinicola soli TaxID=2591634 RepID=A0A514CLF5_9BACT|nr:hypothetical protein [Echinicola soli]QDH80534.1 hypothetical protein FKX85_16395 [Echinicola soli]
MIDTISMVFVVVMIIAFAIPFVIHSKKNKRKQAQVNKRILEFARMHDLSLHFTELWRNQYFLGLDEVKCQLVYLEDVGGGEPIIIDLKTIRRVHINEKIRRIKSRDNSLGDKIIDKIELILEGEVPGQQCMLEVYDGEKFSGLVNEPILAKTWEKRIHEAITKPSLKVAHI